MFVHSAHCIVLSAISKKQNSFEIDNTSEYGALILTIQIYPFASKLQQGGPSVSGLTKYYEHNFKMHFYPGPIIALHCIVTHSPLPPLCQLLLKLSIACITCESCQQLVTAVKAVDSLYRQEYSL